MICRCLIRTSASPLSVFRDPTRVERLDRWLRCRLELKISGGIKCLQRSRAQWQFEKPQKDMSWLK